MYVSVIVSDVHEYVVETLNRNALLSKLCYVDVHRNGLLAKENSTVGVVSDVSSMIRFTTLGFVTRRKLKFMSASSVSMRT